MTLSPNFTQKIKVEWEDLGLLKVGLIWFSFLKFQVTNLFKYTLKGLGSFEKIWEPKGVKFFLYNYSMDL